MTVFDDLVDRALQVGDPGDAEWTHTIGGDPCLSDNHGWISMRDPLDLRGWR